MFSADESASDNSLVAVGEASIVVENNYGYDSPLSTTLGRTTPGGFARVDAVPSGEPGGPETPGVRGRVELGRDRSDVGGEGVARDRSRLRLHDPLQPLGRPRVVRHGDRRRHRRDGVLVRTGTGSMFNNHYSAVTFAPDGSLYVATLAGWCGCATTSRTLETARPA